MIDVPSSTWFTASPHWHWLIVTHFLLGALAGGTYFLSAMIDLAGRADGRRVAQLGYTLTLPLLLVIGTVLIVDLARPDRFWHLLVGNHTLRPMFKHWVPMSTGSWGYLLFGFFALLSFAAALSEHRQRPSRWAQRLRPPGALGVLVAVPGALLALHITGYTGVMLSVLNRPVWSDTPLFGPLFVVSAVTMAAALLVLTGRWLHGPGPTLAALQRIWMWLLAVQVALLVALLVSLGPAARGWLNIWGLWLVVGVAVGMVLPVVALRWRNRGGGAVVSAAAALVLAGGAIVRAAIVFVPEANAP